MQNSYFFQFFLINFYENMLIFSSPFPHFLWATCSLISKYGPLDSYRIAVRIWKNIHPCNHLLKKILSSFLFHTSYGLLVSSFQNLGHLIPTVLRCGFGRIFTPVCTPHTIRFGKFRTPHTIKGPTVFGTLK